jgi:phosphate transport system protein
VGRYFDESYDQVNAKLLEMAALVQDIIARTFDSLATQDDGAARSLIAADEEVDRREVEIDELVLKLLALQQPMAIDLRFLITVLKINADLERMSDQAVNISQSVIRLHSHADPRHLVDFGAMEDAVQEMVRDCIGAFVKGDADLARSVCERDDAVDQMNRDVISGLVEHIRTHPEDADRSVSLLLISRNLERIADLSTNIAEDAVYYIEGRIIRHLHDTPAVPAE